MSKKIEFGNPMLVGAMELVKKNNTPSNRKVFADELMHSMLLSPVIVTPAPEMDEKGRPIMTPENKINMPMFPGPEGKKCIMAFTDVDEMKALKPTGYVSVLPIKFREFAAMVAKTEDDCDGIIINPFTTGMIVNKKTIAVIIEMNRKPEAAEEKVADVTAEAVSEETSEATSKEA